MRKRGVGLRGGGGVYVSVGIRFGRSEAPAPACVFHAPSPIDTQPSTRATTKQASEAAPTVIEGVITGLAPVSVFHRSIDDPPPRRRGSQ